MASADTAMPTKLAQIDNFFGCRVCGRSCPISRPPGERGLDGSSVAPPIQFLLNLVAVAAQQFPSQSRSLFHILRYMFDDFVEMAERGVQFVAGAFFEELHERSHYKR